MTTMPGWRDLRYLPWREALHVEAHERTEDVDHARVRLERRLREVEVEVVVVVVSPLTNEGWGVANNNNNNTKKGRRTC